MRKAIILAGVLLQACVDNHLVHPLKPLEILTAPYQPMVTAALAGSLMYEGNCLLFRDEATGAYFMALPFQSAALHVSISAQRLSLR